MASKQQIEQQALDTYHRFVARRDEVDAGNYGWDAMADFFTEDAVYIDPAWGRQEGRESYLDRDDGCPLRPICAHYASRQAGVTS